MMCMVARWKVLKVGSMPHRHHLIRRCRGIEICWFVWMSEFLKVSTLVGYALFNTQIKENVLVTAPAEDYCNEAIIGTMREIFLNK